MEKNNLTSKNGTGIYELLKVNNKKKFHLSAASKNLTEALERIDVAKKDVAIYKPRWNQDTSEELQQLLLTRLQSVSSELTYLKSIIDRWGKTSCSNKLYLSGLLNRLIRELTEDII